MIGLNFFNSIPTHLDINGPILSFTSQPVSAASANGESVNFVGIATAQFPTQSPPNPADNSGYISYRWYEVGVGALSNSLTIAGAATTSLTVSGLLSPTDNGRQFFLRADYVPSAYGSPGAAKSTPNAINDGLDSTVVGITVYPFITVTKQPSDATIAQTLRQTFEVNAIISDATQGSLNYQWQLNGSNLSDSSTVSGAATTTLSISLRDVGINTVRAVVTSPLATNSPIHTNTVNFNIVSARAILNFESFNGDGSELGYGSNNLFDSPVTYIANPNVLARALSIYAPERDINVRITMAAAAGASRNGYRGGEGGLSIFNYTLVKNTEYILKLGAQTYPSGGTNGGGGGAFLYKKGQILVALGGGGGAGTQGRGGDGGGVSISGENGSGRNAGSGGVLFSPGSLPVQGFFPGGSTTSGINQSSPTAGRLSSCSIGNYWAFIAPCNDIGIIQYRGQNGQLAGSSANILRGYKEGLGYRNNGGNASGDSGGGASGAVGGNAGTGSGSGGGGGSGYSNGEVNIITTRLGGNSGTEAYAKFELIL